VARALGQAPPVSSGRRSATGAALPGLDIANRYGAAPPYSVELGTVGRRAARSSAADERLPGQVRRLAAQRAATWPPSVRGRMCLRRPDCWTIGG
jgi:hypothetical protein